MKANELRLNNYIGILHPGIETKCDPYHITEILQGATMYKPIPLTEEWLVRFGFELVYEKYYFRGNGNCYSIRISKTGGRLYGCGMNALPVYHVHQLQNLYFALTSEELTIKN